MGIGGPFDDSKVFYPENFRCDVRFFKCTAVDERSYMESEL